MLPMHAHRRQFLQFLAASPLFAQDPLKLATAGDALSVNDFESLANKMLPPAHWGYMASGVDDNRTYQANIDGFKHFQLKPRRMIDVTNVDMRTEVFGRTWDSPIFLCPVGGQRMFHQQGELAVARAAKAKKHVQVLSSVTSYAVEDVAKELGEPPWYQLYMPLTWDATEKLVRRVEAAGCTTMAWTVDLLAGRNTETAERFRRMDTRDCNSCHVTPPQRAMYKGLPPDFNPPGANWETLDKLRKLTKMKLLIKGLDSGEDARLAVEHGVDGIVVSNHGGRALETGRGTIEALGEVVDAVGRQVPVFIDGGFRRGTDIYKALAIGAKGVGIGRPYIWGLTSFGQAGVEKVLEILRAELARTMRQCGTTTIAQITRDRIIRTGA